MYKTLCNQGQYTVFEFIDFVKEQLKENSQSKQGDKIQESDVTFNRLENGSFRSEDHTQLVMRERINNTHYLCDNA